MLSVSHSKSASASRSSSPSSSTASTSTTTSPRFDGGGIPLLRLEELKSLRIELAAVPVYQEIMPGLYLGDRTATGYIENLNIHCVIDISGIERDSDYKPAEVLKIIADVPDNYRAPISPYFSEVVELIQAQRQMQHNVLVHCFAGKSRSATLMVAYLMYDQWWSVDQAIDFLTKIRPVVDIPINFHDELELWQKHLGIEVQSHGPS